MEMLPSALKEFAAVNAQEANVRFPPLVERLKFPLKLQEVKVAVVGLKLPFGSVLLCVILRMMSRPLEKPLVNSAAPGSRKD